MSLQEPVRSLLQVENTLNSIQAWIDPRTGWENLEKLGGILACDEGYENKG
jgi:hypothetical protein